jgi:hypothetical protein
MKKNKLIFSLILLLSIVCILLYFFFPVPKFYSVNLIKKIENAKTFVEWKSVTGILDQNFPDFITIRKENIVDTICRSHNIADLNFINNQIIIAFYGKPQQYENAFLIPDQVMGYKIITDTTYIRDNLTR